MSDCVLEDLVPHAVINKVTLESLSTAGEDYQLTCDISIQDTVNTRGEIAKYFFSDNFKKYFKIFTLLSRDNIVPQIIELIEQSNMEDYRKAYAINAIFASPYPILTVTTDLVPSSEIVDSIIALLQQLTTDSYSTSFYSFASDMAVEYGYGANSFDADGNFAYDLKVPIDDRMKFKNSIDVSNCNLYVIPSYYWVSAFLDKGVPFQMTPEMQKFGYKECKTLTILQDNQIVDTRVEDFRIVDRIPEFIVPDAALGYELEVAKIASLSERSNQYMLSDIVSELYSSYIPISDGIGTRNVFYLNLHRILLRNSKYSFLYTNILQNIQSYSFNLKELSPIASARIEKRRVDLDSQFKFINNVNSRDIDSPGMLNFFFTDMSSESIGKYRYTLELSLVDPMEQILETLATDIILDKESILKSLKACAEHTNNSNGYDNIRNELSKQSKSFNTLLLSTANTRRSFKSFKKLFSIFTGQDYDTECPTLSNLSVLAKSRDSIEHLITSIEDFMFEVSKYFPVLNMTDESASTVKPSSYINIRYEFNKDIDYSVQDRGMYDIVEDSISGYDISRSDFAARMIQESSKYRNSPTSNPSNLGYATPNRFSDTSFADLESSTELFFTFFSSIMGTANDPNIDIDLALSDPDNYQVSVDALKKDHAMFESFASNLGMSVTSNSVPEMRSKVESGLKTTTRGIESGTNSKSSNSEVFLDIGAARETIDTKNYKTSLSEIRSKKEELINRFLVSSDGYGILDREEYTQGTKQTKRFKASNYASAGNIVNVPKFIGMHPSFFSRSASKDIFTALFHRLVLNNVFNIFYLSGFDSNMNAIWLPMRDLSQVPLGTLCRLEKFRSDRLGIKDSLAVDREIMSKYFYL